MADPKGTTVRTRVRMPVYSLLEPGCVRPGILYDGPLLVAPLFFEPEDAAAYVRRYAAGSTINMLTDFDQVASFMDSLPRETLLSINPVDLTLDGSDAITPEAFLAALRESLSQQ